MSEHRRPQIPVDGRLALAVGAASTLAAAVVSDVLAGEHPEHTLSIALIVLAVAALRLVSVRRSGSRHTGLFALVNAAVVVQPATHATSKLMSGPVQPPDALHHLPADAPITGVHLLVALLVVGMVVNVERFVLLGAAALGRVVRWLVGTSTGPVEAGRRVDEDQAPRPVRMWVGYLVRRGPPEISVSPAF